MKIIGLDQKYIQKVYNFYINIIIKFSFYFINDILF